MTLVLYFHPSRPSARRPSSPCTRTARLSSRGSSTSPTRHPGRRSCGSGRSANSRCCATKRGIGSSRSRASSSSTSTSTIRARRHSCPRTRNSRSRPASPTASMTSTCRSRCRRSSATGSDRRAIGMPSASRRQRRGFQTAYAMIDAEWRRRCGPRARPSPSPTAPPRRRCSMRGSCCRSATRTSISPATSHA
jgi:hypothetical protein